MTITSDAVRALLRCVLLAPSALRAGETRTWSQGEYADFEKGIVKNLSLRSDGLLTLAPRSRGTVRHLLRLPLGAGAGFQGQPLRRRRHRRQALPHPAGRQGQAAGGTGRAGDPRHRRGFARTASTRPPRPTARSTASPAAASRRSSTIPRPSTSGRWRSTARATCSWPPATRARSTASRPTARAGCSSRPTRRTCARMAMDANGQPDRGHRTGRPGAARFARRRGLRAVPDAQAGSDGGGGGARWRDLRRGGREQAGRPLPAPAPPRPRRPRPPLPATGERSAAAAAGRRRPACRAAAGFARRPPA